MAAPPATSAPRGGPAPATCILWTAASQAPAELAALLEHRRLPLQPASDRFAAMALACCAAKAGLRPVVILDQPERLKGSEELVEALRGRLPSAVIWTFDSRRSPKLGALEAAGAEGRASNQRAGAPVQGQGSLRLVGEPMDGLDAGAAGEPAEGREARANLSSEELEMLLADDPDDARAKR